MKVYFITQKYMEESVILKPKKPESAPSYEGDIPRICVSASILGALSSIGRNMCLGCNTYIYTCDLDESELIQPGFNVPDVDMTGEMWILIEKEFTLHKIIKLWNSDTFCIDVEKETDIYNFNFEIIKEELKYGNNR